MSHGCQGIPPWIVIAVVFYNAVPCWNCVLVLGALLEELHHGEVIPDPISFKATNNLDGEIHIPPILVLKYDKIDQEFV